MGDRAQVHIVDTDVWLYTHWMGTELPAIVSAALSRGVERWNDPGYLARIIFEDMIEASGGRGSLTGFGIDDHKHGDVWRVIEIDCDAETVTTHLHDEITDKCRFETYANDDPLPEWDPRGTR